jgi:ubiquitin carboxyl-terminal hydrolase 36/42
VGKVVNGGGQLSPIGIVSQVKRIGKQFKFGRQEDAHDFVLEMLNCMVTSMINDAGGGKKFDPRTQETTLVHHIFGGYIRSQVREG